MVILHPNGTAEFRFYRPSAQDVRVVGDFCHWNAGHTMTRDEQGWWKLRLALKSGEYRFKYLVDGKVWEADFAAYGVEPDRLGGWNSVLWIDPARHAVARAAA